MCGRYTLRATSTQLAEVFQARPGEAVPERFNRYNLAPQQEAPIVRYGHEGRTLAMARWGLIPGWTKDPAELKSTPINARADRVAQSPMFRSALSRRRCLVPATGFFEWRQHKKTGGKQPYYLCRDDDALFAFAGLWERWEDQAAEALETFTILTTQPNELVRPLHNRMTGILTPDSWDTWLDPEQHDKQQLTDLLKPWPTEGWQALPVSRHVNSPGNDDPKCIEPIDEAGGNTAGAQQPGLCYRWP
jgi:putative SOS response-associated peptidase YedK